MPKDHIPEKRRQRVRARFGNRCSYCLSPQHLVYGLLEVEHIQPKCKDGGDEETNLCLACRLCNNFKGIKTEAIDPQTAVRVPLFNPREQRWSEHFGWSNDGTRIVGRTPCGRATILALRLNNVIAMAVRREWSSVGWHPPGDAGV